MERQTEVFIDLDGNARSVGRLWSSSIILSVSYGPSRSSDKGLEESPPGQRGCNPTGLPENQKPTICRRATSPALRLRY
jgi:hypothetical protein